MARTMPLKTLDGKGQILPKYVHMNKCHSAGRRFKQVLHLGLDVVLPPRCFACGEIVATQGQLCASCWPGVNFITEPCCDKCGLPFEFHTTHLNHCGACLAHPPAFDQARSALHYDDGSRPIVLKFKHGDNLALARSMAEWMARVAANLVEDDSLIIAVPLHRWRLFKRRYNQAALLGGELSKLLARPHDAQVLKRVKPTPSQGGLNAKERRRNVQRAFQVAQNKRYLVRDRPILLVDDVFTTGATVEACAKVLHRAGARSVKIVTFARVVSPQIQAI